MAELEVVNAAAGAMREAALEVFVEGRERREQARLRAARAQGWARALDSNPHADAEVPPKLWLARRSGRPVGVLLGVPFRGRAGSIRFKGHWGVDLYVPDRYRGHGIGAALLTRWRDESPLALGLGITDSAYRIELSLGWTAVALPPRFVCPLTARGALLLRLSPGRVSRAGIDPPPGLAGYEVRLRGAGQPRDGMAPWQAATSGACETLWQALDLEMPAHIERDPAFMRWRFGPASEGGWQWLTLEKGGEARALCLFRVERSSLRKKLWIYELWAPAGDEAGPLLILALLAEARGQYLDVVEGRLTAPHMEPWLREAGFISSDHQDRFIVHAGPALEGLGLTRLPWYLTLSDSGNL